MEEINKVEENNEKINKVEWNDSLLLGIPIIDEQHKKLVAVANELYDAANGPADAFESKITKVLKELADYTVYHFSSEETFLIEHNYPSLDMHKVAHAAFTSEIETAIKKLVNPSQDDARTLYKFVTNWVIQHIARADHIWGSFVRPRLPESEQGPLPPELEV